jgi:hypothetical protein
MRKFKNFLWLAMLFSPVWGMNSFNDNQSDSTQDGSDNKLRSDNGSSSGFLWGDVLHMQKLLDFVWSKAGDRAIEQFDSEVRQKKAKEAEMAREKKENRQAIETVTELLFADWLSPPDVINWEKTFHHSSQDNVFLLAIDKLERLEKGGSQTFMLNKAFILDEIKSMGMKNQKPLALSHAFIELIELLLSEEKSRPLQAPSLAMSWLKNHCGSGERHEVDRQEFQAQLEEYLFCPDGRDEKEEARAFISLNSLLESVKASFPRRLLALLANSQDDREFKSQNRRDQLLEFESFVQRSQQEKQEEEQQELRKFQRLFQLYPQEEQQEPTEFHRGEQEYFQLVLQNYANKMNQLNERGVFPQIDKNVRETLRMSILQQIFSRAQTAALEDFQSYESIWGFRSKAALVRKERQPYEFLIEVFRHARMSEIIKWVECATAQLTHLESTEDAKRFKNRQPRAQLTVAPDDLD